MTTKIDQANGPHIDARTLTVKAAGERVHLVIEGTARQKALEPTGIIVNLDDLRQAVAEELPDARPTRSEKAVKLTNLVGSLGWSVEAEPDSYSDKPALAVVVHDGARAVARFALDANELRATLDKLFPEKAPTAGLPVRVEFLNVELPSGRPSDIWRVIGRDEHGQDVTNLNQHDIDRARQKAHRWAAMADAMEARLAELEDFDIARRRNSIAEQLSRHGVTDLGIAALDAIIAAGGITVPE